MRWISKGWSDLKAEVKGQEHGDASAFDAIIVGSGYGGAVAAARMARAGLRVAVIERGREYQPGEFPTDLAYLPGHVRLSRADEPEVGGAPTGLFELHVSRSATVVTGNGLGGGSLINAAVAVRADPAVFRQAAWPRAFRETERPLDGYYALAEQMLEVMQPSADPAAAKALEERRKYRSLRALGEQVGRVLAAAEGASSAQAAKPVAFGPAPLAIRFREGLNPQGVAQHACRQCGECVAGCNVGAKNTLAMNYLPDAARHGALIFTEVMVTHFSPLVEGGAIVHCRCVNQESEEVIELRSRLVIVAAGTLGSTAILQRSMERSGGVAGTGCCGGAHGVRPFTPSRRLGQRFSGNGDGLYFGVEGFDDVHGIGRPDLAAVARPVPTGGVPATGDAQVPADAPGPTITGIIDTRPASPLDKAMLIQDGAVPNFLAPLFTEWADTAASLAGLARWVRREAGGDFARARPGVATRTQTLLIIGHDNADGQIRLGHGRAVVEWPNALDQPQMHRQRRLADLMERAGATVIGSPTLQPIPDKLTALFQGPALKGVPVMVHPLGGCAMADDCESGVVNDRGQVFDGVSAQSVYEGLYVWDGSIIPMSLGANPLLTIAAVAERAVAMVLAQPGVSRMITMPPGGDDLVARCGAQPNLVAQDAVRLSGGAPAPVADATGKTDAPGSPDLIWRETFFGLDEAARRTTMLRVAYPMTVDPLVTANREAGIDIHSRFLEAESMSAAEPEAPREAGSGERRQFFGLVSRPAPNPPDAQAEPASEVRRLNAGNIRLLETVPRSYLGRWLLFPFRFVRTFLIWMFKRRTDVADALGGAARRMLKAARQHWGTLCVLAGVVATLVAVHGAAKRAGLAWRWTSLEDDPGGTQLVLRLFGRLEWLLQAAGQVALVVGALAVAVGVVVLYWRQAGPYDSGINRLARAVHTWLEDRFAPRDLDAPPARRTAGAYLWALLCVNKHASDVRRFTYTLGFGAPGAPRSETRDLTLTGTKTLRYARKGNLWSDLTQLRVAGNPSWRLLLDGIALGESDRLRLAMAREPLNAVATLARLPAWFVRALLPIYFWDFRLPDYPPDLREPRLLPGPQVVDGESVWPVPIPLDVAATVSDGQVGMAASRVPILLTRYKREASGPEARAILLVHGFGQTSHSFAIHTVEENLVQYLLGQGYVVWLLDARISPALPGARERHTLDEVSRIDVRRAIEFVHAHAGGQKIHLLGQCLGAAAIMMALLDAGTAKNDKDAKGEEPVTNDLAARVDRVILSQVPPLIVGGAYAQGRRTLAAFLRDVMGLRGLDLSAHENPPAVWALLDRVFGTYPTRLPEQDKPDLGRWTDESCPGERFDASAPFRKAHDTATCKRIQAIVGQVILHENVSPESHAAMGDYFGWCNIDVFSQIGKFFEYERLTDKDGVNRYVTQEAIRSLRDLKILFMHGEKNALFLPESSIRSRNEFARINGDANYLYCPLEGASHFDWLIGTRTVRERAYGEIGAFLAATRVAGRPVAEPGRPHGGTPPTLAAGPVLGWARPEGDGIRFRVWALPESRRTTVMPIRMRAKLFGRRGPEATWEKIASSRAPLGASTGERRLPHAWAELDIADKAWLEAGVELRVCAAFFGDDDADVEVTAWTEAAPATESVGDPDSVRIDSRHARLLQAGERHWRAILPEALRAHRPAQEAAPQGRLRFLVGCCRYPGFVGDRHLPDLALARAAQAIEDGGKPGSAPLREAPAFLLLVGDQIYADAAAGVFDLTSRIEKYFDRYEEAFRGEGFSRLASLQPTYMLPDDHEIGNDWDLSQVGSVEERAAIEWAKRCILFFQYSHGPLGWPAGNVPTDEPPPSLRAFEAAGVPVALFDTRLRRDRGLPNRIRGGSVSPATIGDVDTLCRWLEQANATHPDLPKIVVSGSVFLPGLKALDYAENGAEGRSPPGRYPEAGDNWQAFPEDRAQVIRCIAANGIRHVVFVSGDYHLAATVRGGIRRADGSGEEIKVHAIVAPAIYAPMRFANARPDDVVTQGRIDLPGQNGEPAIVLEYTTEELTSANGVADVEVRWGAGQDLALTSSIL